MKKKPAALSRLAYWFIPQRANNHRPKLLHSESLIILTIVLAGFFGLVQTVRIFPSFRSSILGFATNISVHDVVVQTNQQRESQGLAPLTLNSQLSAAALAKAQDMLDNQYWAHTSPAGKQPWDFMKAANYQYRVAGENLARDFSHTSDMVTAWMASPTHRDNILHSQYQQIGVAVVDGRLEGFDTTLVVQMFGTPAGASPSISDQSAAVEASVPAIQLVETQQLAETQQPAQTNQIHNPVLAVPKEDQIEPTSLDLAPLSSRPSSVLAAVVEPLTNLQDSPLFTPLQLTKAVFLAVIILVIFTLIYDSLAIGQRKTMRLVGENLGHILLFISVSFLLILFKGGVVK